MIKSSFSAVLAISLGVLVATPSSADERCKQFDTLRAKYAGVQLTPGQKALKVKLVAWYGANCGKHEVADVKSVALSNTIR
jgi:hypothetical protein